MAGVEESSACGGEVVDFEEGSLESKWKRQDSLVALARDAITRE